MREAWRGKTTGVQGKNYGDTKTRLPIGWQVTALIV